MTITFTFTPALLQRAHELHYKIFFPWRRRIILILGAMALWAGALLFLILGEGGNKFVSVSLMGYGALAIVIHFIWLKTTGRRTYKRLAAYHDPFTFDISEEGILISIRDREQMLAWNEVKKAVISKDLILIYPTDAVFYLFPKDNFSGNEFEEFEAIVKEKVGKVY